MLWSLAIATLLLADLSSAAAAPLAQDTACRPLTTLGWYWNHPTFTPYTRAPELRNRDQVRAALHALYPAQLRARGVSGITLVWALVDRCGAVVNTRVRQSSGHELFDSAALRIAQLMHFSPALQEQEPVDVWVQLPIVFGAAPYPPPQPVPAAIIPEARSDALPRLDAPRGYVGPSLLNAGELRAWLQAAYAALGGRGGDTLRIALHVDPQGRVTDARVASSSGWPSLDSLGLTVARHASLTPAVDPNRRYCSLWTTLPLRFPAVSAKARD